MVFSKSAYDERAARAKTIAEELAADGVRFVEMQFPDMNGMMRGKYTPLAKGLSAGGTGVSCLLYSARGGDNLTIDFWADFDNGFPKVVGIPDYDTVTRCPWRPDTAAVLCDFYMEDGTPCPMDARQILKGVVAEYAELGLQPRASVEWEFYLFEADDDLMRAKRYSDLKSFGRGWDFYSLSKYPNYEEFGKEFMGRCLDSGIGIEAFHTEYGHGMFEFTCGHEDPLKAADDALRAKGYLRSLADEYGLVPTFMPALHMHSADSHNGAHHNVSVWRDGVNACWDPETRDMSKLAGHFAAGMMETMPDLHLAFRPWVNSHRRMDRLSWAPEDTSWGPDNHAVALRVVYGSMPEKMARLEHRAPGPDINPYLSLAALFAGGLKGIREELAPPEYAVGDPIENGNYTRLPKTLEASVAAMRDSAIARSILGDQLVDHLVNVHAEEAAEFASWAEANGVDTALDAPVTQWEYEQYFTWA
jgi:glutamine synthetase